MEHIKKLIDNITLSKSEEKLKYGPLFEELYGNPQSKIIPKEPSYLRNYLSKIKEISLERTKHTTNKEFYKAIADKFASEYIPNLIKEFNITDTALISELEQIANGTSIKVFETKEEADEWIKEETNGEQERLNGDYGAFRFGNYICFTPGIESQGNVSYEESINYGCKMLSSMIHETIHILINVKKEERFTLGEVSKLTSAGYILDEGLVEIYSLEFAKKYNYIHMPALYYMNNVELCRLLREYHGKEKFNHIAFNGAYEELLPNELLTQYKTNEIVRYFARLNITDIKANLDINENMHL